MIPPGIVDGLSVEARARFLLRRYSAYKAAFLGEVPGRYPGPIYRRFKELADELAREDLQARLGRRGSVALEFELEIQGDDAITEAAADPLEDPAKSGA